MKLASYMFCLILTVFIQNVVYSKSISNIFKRSAGELYNGGLEVNEENEMPSIHESHRSSPRLRYHQRVKKRSYRNQDGENLKKRTCGIMYKNKEPIGILQPFEESYKLIPVKNQKMIVEMNQIPSKRSIMGTLYPRKYGEDTKIQNIPLYSNNKYPSILANFKIGTRLDNKKLSENKRKRNSQREVTNSVEKQLEEILDDMGLIDDDDDEGKREIKIEDENLEKGSNNVPMVKEQEAYRNKDVKRGCNSGTTGATPLESVIIDQGNVHDRNNKRQAFDEYNDETALRKRELDRMNTENKLNFLLSSVHDNLRKRSEGKINDNILEDLTKSGDLSLSGNKSPLAYVSDNNSNKEADINSDLSQYEDKVRREIQNKIQALKEEVKREIASLKEEEVEPNSLIRKKRDVSDTKRLVRTLLDEETDDVNPLLNADEEAMKPHVRKRRDLSYDEMDDKNLMLRAASANMPTACPNVIVTISNTSIGDTTIGNTTISTNTTTTMPMNSINVTGGTSTTGQGEAESVEEETTGGSGGSSAATSAITGTGTAVTVLLSNTSFGQMTMSKNNRLEMNNNSEININFEDALENVHISVNVTPSTFNKCDRQSRELRPAIDWNRQPNSDHNLFNLPSSELSNLQTKKPLTDDSVMNNLYLNTGLRFPINVQDQLQQQNTKWQNLGQDNLDQIKNEDTTLMTFQKEILENSFNNKLFVKRKCSSKGCNGGCDCSKSNLEESCNCGEAGCNCGETACSCSSSGCNCKESSKNLGYNNDYDYKQIRKRSQIDRKDLDSFEDYSYEDADDSEDNDVENRERRSNNKEDYYVDMNPDVYKLTHLVMDSDDYESDVSLREKRETFEDFIKNDNNAAPKNHLAAIKSRSMQYPTNPRVRRGTNEDSRDEQVQLIDMSDEDLFGPLPQSFEGELGRYKRVKRVPEK